MTKIQLDNLIEFCFLFHPCSDCDWRRQSPDYIKEKWDKYIGIDAKHTYYDKLYFTNDISDWLKIWKVSNEDWIKLKKIIQFIMTLSKKPIFINHYYPETWKLSEIIDIFENQIGSVNDINQKPYNHIHALLQKEIEKWLSITQNNREYNLSQIISSY